MKLIIGLGNPEERYSHTRHNVGFRAVDSFVADKGGHFQNRDKFRSLVADLTIGGEKVIVAKPSTYYNNVGEAGRTLADFYKIDPADILIVHDELALPFGTIRTRIGGSDAGNNGIKSMNQNLGPDTARIRIGVYNDLRDRIDDADFVLSNFTKDETETLETQLFTKTNQLIDNFIAGSFDHTTHS